MKSAIASERAKLLLRIFPNGVPRLWCPPLTHYDPQGAIDRSRMAAHLRHLAPCVGGVLIPGSTGDGWELTAAERREVLTVGVEQAQQLRFQVLIGALHPDTKQSMELIREDLEWLRARFGEGEDATVIAKAPVCGFTICPPRGKQLSQEEIGRALAGVLDLGLPTAIYQLPQVTQNEMGPELVADLAARYENFIFFKDTSGLDAVARSGKDLFGVFTARGAEGDYAGWLKVGGGPYEGFLLASANCFARELQQVIEHLTAGRVELARGLSDRLTAAVGEAMALASGVSGGNPFANANKAIDHFLAYGPRADDVPAPRLHSGGFLPLEFVRATGGVLSAQDLMPAKGYLE